jgi:putative oxygen-independent coproporphyrinogen III oxidase
VPHSCGGSPVKVRSIYVHAPFCSRRCVYCDFAVHVSREGDTDAWLSALRSEWLAIQTEGWAPVADELDTLYVGGGTPSILHAAAMDGLANVVGRGRLRSSVFEWTVEANPESFTRELARAWRGAGVNRVSLGVQSFDPNVLRWMGRLHRPDGARAAVRNAGDAGFEELSVDLIFGLPEHLGRSWSGDLEEVLRLDVPHVSLYGLTAESTTPLGRAVEAGREALLDEDGYREEFLLAAELLSREGYRHYEVSNFARDDLLSRHNSVYWSGRPYLGMGNGAHSYVHPIRRWNERDWPAYRDRTATAGLAVAGSEVIDEEAGRLERLWLALRTDLGLEPSDLGTAALERLRVWERKGLGAFEKGRFRLSPEGWLVMDRLTVELEEAERPRGEVSGSTVERTRAPR